MIFHREGRSRRRDIVKVSIATVSTSRAPVERARRATLAS